MAEGCSSKTEHQGHKVQQLGQGSYNGPNPGDPRIFRAVTIRPKTCFPRVACRGESLKKGKIEDRDDQYRKISRKKKIFKKEGWQEKPAGH